MLSFPDLIRKKRDGEELSKGEIDWLIQEVVQNIADDCQIGALLMAIYLKGMTNDETVNLTKAMLYSGEILEWDAEWKDLLVDKHSTGGCGDKVSLVLAPALAACGYKVPMISGRGLEFTGGTLDKMESIPGFKIELTEEEMLNALQVAGCFIAGTTKGLVPADRELYRRRDVTATVDSIPLITSSILSKKASEGIKFLVMDVKVGNAAFLKSKETAMELATTLINVSAGLGIQTQVALTHMDTPIGLAVGNSLEVAEAVECLKGKGPDDLVELVSTLGGMILQMKGQVKTLDYGRSIILNTLESGEALHKFRLMLTCQGVDDKISSIVCNGDMWSVLPCVPPEQISVFKASRTGYLSKVDAFLIATVCWKLGAGRSTPDQPIDPRVGIKFFYQVGDYIKEDAKILEIHHNTPVLHPSILEELVSAITVTQIRKDQTSRIIEVVAKQE